MNPRKALIAEYCLPQRVHNHALDELPCPKQGARRCLPRLRALERHLDCCSFLREYPEDIR